MPYLRLDQRTIVFSLRHPVLEEHYLPKCQKKGIKVYQSYIMIPNQPVGEPSGPIFWVPSKNWKEAGGFDPIFKVNTVSIWIISLGRNKHRTWFNPPLLQLLYKYWRKGLWKLTVDSPFLTGYSLPPTPNWLMSGGPSHERCKRHSISGQKTSMACARWSVSDGCREWSGVQGTAGGQTGKHGNACFITNHDTSSYPNW